MQIIIKDNEGIEDIKDMIKTLVRRYFETDDIKELINELEGLK